MTGAKTRKEIQDAYNKMLPALQLHKKRISSIPNKSNVEEDNEE